LTSERAADLGIDLRLGVAATGLDPLAYRVRLADGDTVGYGRVVVATGASARPSPWSGEAVHTLRSLADSDRLKAAMAPGSRVVVIGAGYIGAEVAATARGRGCQTTVLDVATNPYARSLGEGLGAALCGIHARHGVQARFGVVVAGIAHSGGSAVVELSDGSAHRADTVVVGIGASPNTGWLSGAGLILEDGVACDEFGRALGVPDVFAVGDAARWGPVRHEHWTSAVEQGRAVGHNIARPDELVGSGGDGYVWSDQYDWKIQLAGSTGAGWSCELVGDRDLARPTLAGLFHDAEGRLVGVATLNWPKTFLECRRLIGTADAPDLAQDLRGRLGVPDRVTA
jgi:NADPH-dependent 2,4-dienoyl-CoA reductase/sulfur reductase-like enzyme